MIVKIKGKNGKRRDLRQDIERFSTELESFLSSGTVLNIVDLSQSLQNGDRKSGNEQRVQV